MSSLSLGAFSALTAEISAKAAAWTRDSARSAEAGACGFVAAATAEKFCSEIEAHLVLIRRLSKETDAVTRSIERSGR